MLNTLNTNLDQIVVLMKSGCQLKEEDNSREVIGIVDNDVDDLGNAIHEYNQKYKIIWPLHIFPCQKIDFFGEKCTLFHIFKLEERI